MQSWSCGINITYSDVMEDFIALGIKTFKVSKTIWVEVHRMEQPLKSSQED